MHIKLHAGDKYFKFRIDLNSSIAFLLFLSWPEFINVLLYPRVKMSLGSDLDL